MAFGIIRVRNLKIGDLKSTELHNARLYNSLEEYPKNIDPNGYANRYYYTNNEELMKNDFDHNGDLTTVVNERLEGVKGLRKDSNIALEYVVAISDVKVWKENYHFTGFSGRLVEFMEDRHGKGSVVAKYDHMDEANPHVHFVVVPTIEKEVKFKNRFGEGSKIEKRLDIKKHTGGPLILRKLQDDYHSYLKNNWENKLGVPFYRGTLKENQSKVYIERTSHEIAQLKSNLATLTNELDKKRVEVAILEKEAQKAEKSIVLQSELENKRNSKNWERKGVNGLDKPFHKHPKL